MARRLNFLPPWVRSLPVSRLTLPMLLVLALLAASYSGYVLYQDWRYHNRASAVSLQQLLASPYSAASVMATQPSRQQQRMLLVDAWRLAQAQHGQQALALYARVSAGQDQHLARTAHYNSANLYLRQAMQLLDERGLAAWDSVKPMLAMAKQGYQRALRIDPAFYDAKYNLELALRLAPDIHSATSKQQADDEEQDMGERPTGWPSIPGFPRGMP